VKEKEREREIILFHIYINKALENKITTIEKIAKKKEKEIYRGKRSGAGQTDRQTDRVK
jgi:hypothetical protein